MIEPIEVVINKPVIQAELTPCPLCGGRVHVEPCNSEGEISQEDIYGWTSTYYRIAHYLSDVPTDRQCPIAMHKDEGLGVWVYLTPQGAAKDWNEATNLRIATIASNGYHNKVRLNR